MVQERDSLIKIIIGLLLVFALFFLVKKLLLPIIPDLSLETIRVLPMSEFLKISESVIIMIMLAGFLAQELLHALLVVLQRNDHSKTAGSRWSDLVYVLVGVFGSAGLYIGISNLY